MGPAIRAAVMLFSISFEQASALTCREKRMQDKIGDAIYLAGRRRNGPPNANQLSLIILNPEPPIPNPATCCYAAPQTALFKAGINSFTNSSML